MRRSRVSPSTLGPEDSDPDTPQEPAIISVPSSHGRPPDHTPRIGQPDGGTTDRTGIGLGMEAPIGRILILGRAGRTHLELGHAGVGAIIGDRANDAQPRPTMGAVGERIAIAAIARVGDLGGAGCTGCGIGNHPGLHQTGPALDDAEGIRRRPSRRAAARCHRCAQAAGTRPSGHGKSHRSRHCCPKADQHALAVVADIARRDRRHALSARPLAGSQPLAPGRGPGSTHLRSRYADAVAD